MRKVVWPLAALAIMAAGSPARADAIDGNWCFADGRQFQIQGPTIVTPGGTSMRGDYDRHGFAYVVPEGEAGAGNRVLMLLLDDYTLHLWPDAAPQPADRGEPEVWNRCQAKTS